jgi:hypothetical protein
LSTEGKMDVNQTFTISQVVGVRRVRISLKRVAIWTLIFTDAFFLSYFFAKLFHWV